MWPMSFVRLLRPSAPCSSWLADRNATAADWREVGEDVLRACGQQKRLLEACLALSKSELGVLRLEQVDLAVIAAAALRAHDLSEFETFEAFEPASTTGDPALLDRLLANLISNAFRHNIAGGRVDVATCIRSKRAVLGRQHGSGRSVTRTAAPLPALSTPRIESTVVRRRRRRRRRTRPRDRGRDRRRTQRTLERPSAARWRTCGRNQLPCREPLRRTTGHRRIRAVRLVNEPACLACNAYPVGSGRGGRVPRGGITRSPTQGGSSRCQRGVGLTSDVPAT